MYKNFAKNSLSRAFRSALHCSHKEESIENNTFGIVPKKIKKAEKFGQSIEGFIEEKNKGGLKIKLKNGGINAFCPLSECRKHFNAKDIDEIIRNKSILKFKVLRTDQPNSIVVSWKRAAEEEGISRAQYSIENNKHIKGRVRKITEYCAFIDIGGLDGLIHISKIPKQKILKINEILEVRVLTIDKPNKRISLSLLY